MAEAGGTVREEQYGIRDAPSKQANFRNEPSADDLDPTLSKTGTQPSEFNEVRATKHGYFLTTYLLPATPSAKTFDLHLDATAKRILRTQTVVWPDVALPAPASLPAAPQVFTLRDR